MAKKQIDPPETADDGVAVPEAVVTESNNVRDTALEAIQRNEFAVAIRDAFQANGLADIRDLPRAVMPMEGGILVKYAGNEVEAVDRLTGVYVGSIPKRALFGAPFNAEKKSQPVCASSNGRDGFSSVIASQDIPFAKVSAKFDRVRAKRFGLTDADFDIALETGEAFDWLPGLAGEVIPACETCKYNRFGSAKDGFGGQVSPTGRGKACSQYEYVLVAVVETIKGERGEVHAPTGGFYIIQVSAKNLEGFRAMKQKLTRHAIPISEALVTWTKTGAWDVERAMLTEYPVVPPQLAQSLYEYKIGARDREVGDEIAVDVG